MWLVMKLHSFTVINIVLYNVLFCESFDLKNVVYAINAGGSKHVDNLGIVYEQDDLEFGISSGYGEYMGIMRVDKNDAILYQQERYSRNSFSYNIPIPENGNYVLVLKFCEVYFNEPKLKIFDVALNDIVVLENLDIFAKVGKGAAHDEYVPFTVSNGAVVYDGFRNEINDNYIIVSFMKGKRDNPKINAFYLYKGTVDEIPKLPFYMPPEKPKADSANKKKAKSRKANAITRTVTKITFKKNSMGEIDLSVYNKHHVVGWHISVLMCIFFLATVWFCKI